MIIFEAVNKSHMKVFSWLVVSSILLFMTSCSHDPFDISTDGISVPIKHTNLDSLIGSADSTELLAVLMNQRLRTPDIIDYQLGYCFRVGSVDDPMMVHNFVSLRKDDYLTRLEKRISEKFPKLSKRTQKITDAFVQLKAHFPNGKFPGEIVYMNSYFASSAFCTDHEIAIGLERYLGAETDVIKELPSQEFFPWIKQKMDAQYMERDAVAAWVMTHMVEEKEGSNTVEAMIRWGKIIYLTEAAFPDMPKHWIMRYKESEYKWAIENERAFWDYLVDQKMLFETNERTQANLLNDAPFTTGLPEKGPDRLGQFLGWRILQSYMEQYDVTLQELMAKPYTELLQEYEIAE
jgi:hypothetical protein